MRPQANIIGQIDYLSVVMRPQANIIGQDVYLCRHPTTGLLQMYPETRAMDDPYDIHSRGFSDHSAVIAEVALSRKSIGTLIIPEWHVLRTLATAAGVLEL